MDYELAKNEFSLDMNSCDTQFDQGLLNIPANNANITMAGIHIINIKFTLIARIMEGMLKIIATISPAINPILDSFRNMYF